MIGKFITCTWLSLAALTPCLAQRVMAPDDPNRNHQWLWTPMAAETMYYAENPNLTPTALTSFLPFRQGGNRLTESAGNIFHEDGWMLVHKDFGTPKEGVAMPYFTLYNKYRGLFRVMVFNAGNMLHAQYLGSLTLLSPEAHADNRSPILTFNNHSGACFVDNYHKGESVSWVAKMNKYEGWAAFDFHLLGFDPALNSKDPVLQFNLFAMDKSILKLAGKGDLRLQQDYIRVMAPSLSTSQAMVAHTQATLTGGSWCYNSVQDWVANVGSNPQFQNEPWFNSVQGVVGLGTGNYPMALAGFYGLLNGFVGGSNKAMGWEPMSFRGQLTLGIDGTLEQDKPLKAITFALNMADHQRHPCPVHRPVQAIPWGMFNVQEAPQITGALAGKVKAVRLAKAPILHVNPDMGMTLLSTTYRLNTYHPTWVWDASQGKNVVAKLDYSAQPLSYGQAVNIGPYELLADLTVEMKFRTLAPTREADHEYTVIKKVPVQWIDPPTPNGQTRVSVLPVTFDGAEYMLMRGFAQ